MQCIDQGFGTDWCAIGVDILDGDQSQRQMLLEYDFVEHFRGVGDGVFDNTHTLRGALRFIASTHSDDEHVRFRLPKGVYLSGAVNISKSNFTLTIEDGALLK